MTFPVTIVGMGLGPDDLTPAQCQCIDQAELLVGARRHLECFPQTAAEKVPLDKELDRLAQRLKAEMAFRRIVVLASGDPLFFGIGAYLLRCIGAEQVVVLPNVTAVAAAFARLKRPWQNVPVVSLHGRASTELFYALARWQGPWMALYTDPQHGPAWLARRLLETGRTQVRLCVLERMGMPSERMGWHTPAEAAAQDFAEPNLVVLAHESTAYVEAPAPYLGLPDESFQHEAGLITKSEIRAVSLSKLRLRPQHVFWDLGAGSGALAIEAAALIKSGRIIAVEQNEGRIARMRTNALVLGAGSVEILHAVLPDGLDRLPDPDRIFVGGGGRALAAILQAALPRLRPAGRIVVNTILLENLHAASAVLEAAGLAVETVQVQVSRGKAMPWGRRLQAHNPVWIIAGQL